CFAVTDKDNPQPADFQPSPQAAAPTDASAGQPFAGIYIGTGGPFPASTPLEQYTIQPYLMNAQRLKQGGVEGADPNLPRCAKLLTKGQNTYPDGGGLAGQELLEGVDFWKLAPIPKGTLKQDHTYML